jgi:hypothetical protein
MTIHLETKDLINTQQMEVAVNGPDGATHLILCTGTLNLDSASHETYVFLVGPQLSRRQFVGVIASGALSRLSVYENNSTGNTNNLELGANLKSIDANYDDVTYQVKVRVNVSSSKALTILGISYNVSILAEMTEF